MEKRSLSGTRVRERRMQMGLKQAELAQMAGISPSYLNLIEHNRRRIAGKLLGALASALDVPSEALSQGADARLLSDLRDAAQSVKGATANLARAEELAGKFPGWASVIAAQHRTIVDMDQQVNALVDRFSQDPFLFETLHEILTTVTSIRSTASLLAEPEDLTDVWRKRFSDNLSSDSQRLSEAGAALSKYVEADLQRQATAYTPQEEFNQALTDHGLRFAGLEDGTQTPGAAVEQGFGRLSPSAKIIALAHCQRYARDVDMMPTAQADALLAAHGPNPMAWGQAAPVAASVVLRRIAARADAAEVGFWSCDSTGTALIRALPPGFIAPRPQSACFDWPLFTALRAPSQAVTGQITLDALPWATEVSRQSRVFDATAWCEPVGASGLAGIAQFESTMILVRDGNA